MLPAKAQVQKILSKRHHKVLTPTSPIGVIHPCRSEEHRGMGPDPSRAARHVHPRAAAEYKRSPVRRLVALCPWMGRGNANEIWRRKETTGCRCTAKSIRWVRYGGEASREAKSKNDRRASADHLGKVARTMIEACGPVPRMGDTHLHAGRFDDGECEALRCAESVRSSVEHVWRPAARLQRTA